MAWSFPVYNAIRALAAYATSAVITASQTVYANMTDAEANRRRFELAVSLVLENEEAMKAVRAILSKALLGFLTALSPVAKTIVGIAVEIAYQTYRAATKPVEAKPAPVEEASTTADAHEQAEPGAYAFGETNEELSA